MTESQRERINPGPSRRGYLQHTTHAADTAPPLPRLITKKSLCVYFGLVNARGRMNYHRLYLRVLTPEVIDALGMSAEQMRHPGMKEFDAVQSATLREILKIGG